MKITNVSQLKDGEFYWFFDIDLSQKGDKLRSNTPPTKIEFAGNNGKGWRQLEFYKLKKNGDRYKKPKTYSYNKNTGDFYWSRDLFENYSECCDAYDLKVDGMMLELYQRQMVAKRLYDTLDSKKIGIRSSKLERILSENTSKQEHSI